MIAMDEHLLTVKEVAKKARLTPYTVRKYLRDGIIPAMKLEDGTWLVKASDIDAYLKKRVYQKPEES